MRLCHLLHDRTVCRKAWLIKSTLRNCNLFTTWAVAIFKYGTARTCRARLMPLYLEDLRVGQRFTSGEYQMTEERIKSFAEEFDPQPFHLDDAAAENTVFRGLAASGWHTAAVAIGNGTYRLTNRS